MRKVRPLKKLFQYFLQGLIILAPIMITLYAVTALFSFIDNILPAAVVKVFPHWLRASDGSGERSIPGIGFVVLILLVVFVGYISGSFIVGRLVDLFDSFLERMPGVKIIYTTVKDFFEAFAGNKRKFDKAVLASIIDPEVWQIGFITQQDLHQFGMEEYVAVYVPKSYAFAGHLYFIKRERIRLLKDMSASEAMKFAISGGVTAIEE